ncbi:lysozyme [Acidovorax phage ACPWH]|nr:lysozyme [Acidovorax phage ACPWH]QXV72259.1 lysozyme [Acidovorax phage ACF1]
MNFSVEQLAAATSAPISYADAAHPHLQSAMLQFGIDSLLRQAAFLATVSVESARLTKMEEDLYYKDATRLASIYRRAFKDAQAAVPYTRNPKGLSELLYKGYHGRGMLGLTWRENYDRAGRALGYDYVGNPGMVCELKHAALTAAWFWDDKKCNEAADKADMTEITRRVNGSALMHLDERKLQYMTALKELA